MDLSGRGIGIYQSFINYLIEQARNPTGLIGNVMTKIWSDYFKNLSEWSLSYIDTAKQNTVLDVGFGGGSNIKYMKDYNASYIFFDLSKSRTQRCRADNL